MSGFDCTTCGQHHDELPMCLGLSAPELWLRWPDTERSRARLSSDQCVLEGRYYAILGRILLPVVDAATPFTWLAWVSLSEASFRRCDALWHTPGREQEPPCFGWLHSALPGYSTSTLSLKTHVQAMPVGERPLITLEATPHPLALEQRHGITLARVQQLVEASLHG